MNIDRKEIRKKWAELVETEMVGTGKLLVSVSAYPTQEVTGSPFLAIRSESTERNYDFVGSDFSGTIELKNYILVSLNKDVANGYDEEDAMDLLDDIDYQFSEAVKKYRQTDKWENLTYAEPTKVSVEQVENEGYYLKEEITLRFQIL